MLQFTMERIRTQSALLSSIYVLVVVGVFVENIDATIEFNHSENDENPEHAVFYEAAKLTQSLASRNHTLIVTLFDVLMTVDQLEGKIDDVYRNRVGYTFNVRDDCKLSLMQRFYSTIEYTASNDMTINSIFDHTLGMDENSIDQLNAQIIRHQLNAPMKVIQSLLSLTISEIPPSISLDSEETNLHVQNKTQLFQHIVEQFKYTPRVIKEVVQDLDAFLGENSNYFFLKTTLDSLQRLADEILESNQIPAVNVTRSLSNEWKYLITIVNITDDQPHLAKQLQNLTRCPELGVAAFNDCRQNPTKLAVFSEQVNEFQGEFQKWKQFEQNIYDIVIPVLKEIEKSLDEEHATNFGGQILPILPELTTVLSEMQQHLLHSDGLSRATEDTRLLIRMIISLNKHIQLCADKEKLALELQKIENFGDDLPRKIKILDGIITANLMLEICKTTKEVLKMRIIPFDQDYLQLCDIPRISEPSEAAEHVKQNLLQNVQTLKSEIRFAGAVLRKENLITMIASYMELKPLYVWKYADFKNEIMKLLSGEEVILNADINKSPDETKFVNGVKFTKILINFHLANESRQREFYKAINGIFVELTMIGDNYFRCDSGIYYVPTDVNNILGYFIKSDDNGIDISTTNGVYNVVLERINKNRADAFLSPYNIWQMRLDSSQLPRKLNEFVGEEMDLHLIGEWSYVMNREYGKDACDDLNKNYHHD